MREEIKNHRSKCYKCMRPESSCICSYTSAVDTQTRFVILMHPKEFKKEKNGTGHMTHLQLANSELIVGVDFTNNNRINQILQESKGFSFLLYPGSNSFNLSINNSKETQNHLGKAPTFFVIDGTWPCARKMLKLSKNLNVLPRVSFDNKIKSKFIIKQQPEPLCLSTIESVNTVVDLLIKNNLEHCDTSGFLLPFEKMIAYQVACVMNPHNNNYRSRSSRKISKKDMYKKTSQRGTIYEK